MFTTKSISRLFSVLFVVVFMLALVEPAHAAPASLAVPAPAASPLLDGAPDHCEITGGNSNYERIESATVEMDASGLYHLKVVIQLLDDDYPGYLSLNAWMDWPNDGQWADQVVNAEVSPFPYIYQGRMTYETTFIQPIGITVAPATWLRVTLIDGPDDWEDPCQVSWSYGDYTDIPVANFPDAAIGDITVKGIGSFKQKPTTGYWVDLSANITLPPGWTIKKCIWTGMWLPGDGDKNDQCRYIYYAIPGSGPGWFTYGRKSVLLTVVFSKSGVVVTREKPVSYNVYFKKDGDDDRNGIPNWFEYWKDDGAVPELSTSTTPIEYKKLSNIRGEYSHWYDTIYLGLGASTELANGGLTTNPLPATATCPGKSFTPKAQGIDSVATCIAHEARHKWSIYTQWETFTGGWIRLG